MGWWISIPSLFLAKDDPQEVGGSLLPVSPQLGEGEGMLPHYTTEGQRRNVVLDYVVSQMARLVMGWNQQGNAKASQSQL